MASSQTRKPSESAALQKEPEVATQPTEEEAKVASGKFVKHLPHELFSARVISEDAWRSIGVYDQKGVEWNDSNNFRLPVEMFNEGALEYLTKRDDGFEIVEG
ncbi:hypothetical protein SEA_LITTLEFELLA_19 [Gordonia phage LittleFella]|nr:hypothetical protein SEA_LITTLEFELLA_19 [Gordonia phage LittleFella]